MMVCKILNIRKQRTIIPETQETKYLRSTIASGSCLERISRKWYREKEPRQNPANFLSSRDDVLRIWGKPGSYYFQGRVPVRRDLHRELQRSVADFLWAFSRVLFCAYVWGNHPRLVKKTNKRIRGNRAQRSHGIGNSYSSQSGKLHNSWGDE